MATASDTLADLLVSAVRDHTGLQPDPAALGSRWAPSLLADRSFRVHLVQGPLDTGMSRWAESGTAHVRYDCILYLSHALTPIDPDIASRRALSDSDAAIAALSSDSALSAAAHVMVEGATRRELVGDYLETDIAFSVHTELDLGV